MHDTTIRRISASIGRPRMMLAVFTASNPPENRRTKAISPITAPRSALSDQTLDNPMAAAATPANLLIDHFRFFLCQCHLNIPPVLSPCLPVQMYLPDRHFKKIKKTCTVRLCPSETPYRKRWHASISTLLSIILPQKPKFLQDYH